MAGSRSASRNGLTRYPKTPASTARDTSSSCPYAVSITIGIGRSSRMRRAASMPSSFGIFTSMIATSGSRSSARATASSPSRASPTTSIPARFNNSTRSSRMIVSSSATRTRMRGGYPERRLALVPHQRLREHPRVPVGVVERRELDHALDLVRLAVELRSERLEVRARGNDVLDAEGRHGAAVLELLALAEADEDSAPR